MQVYGSRSQSQSLASMQKKTRVVASKMLRPYMAREESRGCEASLAVVVQGRMNICGVLVS
eukprot:scaffold627626_cov22-Prasinocladus_malaysianus.AAC.1